MEVLVWRDGCMHECTLTCAYTRSMVVTTLSSSQQAGSTKPILSFSVCKFHSFFIFPDPPAILAYLLVFVSGPISYHTMLHRY